MRERAHRLLALGLDGKLDHFRVDLGKLDDAADLVIEITRGAYPTLDVPFHSRWRHFVADGEDRWSRIRRAHEWRDAGESARAAFDLATVSVLLDAGAGPDWSYRDPASGARVGRSEGLALASLDMFAAGAFSSDPRRPLRVDAAALQDMSSETLCRHFQVDAGNPLLGVEGRVALLRRLGATVAASPEVFARADTPRPGGLFDHLCARCRRSIHCGTGGAVGSASAPGTPSGPRAWSSTACLSAIAGAIRRSRRTTRHPG